MRKRNLFIIGLILIFCFFSVNAESVNFDLNLQRTVFQRAEYALNKNKRIEFLLLRNSLLNYPLYPYLIYEDLIHHLDSASESEVNNFLTSYSDTPLAWKLRENWLEQLAKQKKWDSYIRYYKPNDNLELQCFYLQALNETKNPLASSVMKQVWLTGESLPTECENVFQAWYKSNNLPVDLIWSRLRLALNNKNDKLMQQLIPWLPSAQQEEFLLWQKVIKNPSLLSQPSLFKTRDVYTHEIIMDGFKRWAKNDPEKLSTVWDQLKNNFDLSSDDQQLIQKQIAIGLASNNDPNAARWLTAVNPAVVDQKVREWRIRTALAQQNWQQVDSLISQLPENEKSLAAWRYWQAKAKANIGQTNEAKKIYSRLAKEIDYYGLLASKELQQSYQPTVKPITIDPSAVQQLKDLPAIQRAIELYALRRPVEARREWQWAIDNLTSQQMKAAAKLAGELNWYDRAIASAAKASAWNDIGLRFPLAYQGEIKRAAKQEGLNPAWVYGIIRQESNFMEDARSLVGALGLMQLMPNTANLLAKLSLKEPEILDTKKNILLGSRYLKQLSDSYKGNILFASAAYNIGPTRLQKRIPLYKKYPPEIWVELLPWQETRNYVKAVVLNTVIYQKRLGLIKDDIKERY